MCDFFIKETFASINFNMKISYNWLKWYIPDAPKAEDLADIITYHIAEVESVEEKGDDKIFDIKILPNRAHDLLSHMGVAKELSSLLNIAYVDPTPKYKIPESKPTKLIKEIHTPKCRRYMGRIVRNVKIGPSPEWVVKHLESIGQRSINNIVDATNIVTFDCGQPSHVFDLNKVKDLKLQVREAKDGEEIELLGGLKKTLKSSMLVISDFYGNSLDIAGVKGGKYAELTNETTDIILECANFDPTSVRKTAQALNIFTDAKKRFENDLSPELAEYGMRELSALILEMCPEAIFEDIVDVYPVKQEQKKLSFSVNRISKILGLEVSSSEVEGILKRYHFEYKNDGDKFDIVVPFMRQDLEGEEDMAEEIGRILGYDKVKPKIPKINFKPKVNEIYAKIQWARNKLLNDGYSEVMTYAFGEGSLPAGRQVEVLQSASDKKFLRTNLSDGLKESLRVNKINYQFLGLKEIKIFEIGAVFQKGKEEINVAFNEKEKIVEKNLDEFCETAGSKNYSIFALGGIGQGTHDAVNFSSRPFRMWSLFPFVARDVAVWVPEGITSFDVEKVIKENAGDLVIRGPELFDEFKKPASSAGGDGKTSYAFRLVFQSYERTLTDTEVNEIMNKINDKIKENKDWQVR